MKGVRRGSYGMVELSFMYRYIFPAAKSRPLHRVRIVGSRALSRHLVVNGNARHTGMLLQQFRCCNLPVVLELTVNTNTAYIKTTTHI